MENPPWRSCVPARSHRILTCAALLSRRSASIRKGIVWTPFYAVCFPMLMARSSGPHARRRLSSVTAAHDSILRLIDAGEESTRVVSLPCVRSGRSPTSIVSSPRFPLMVRPMFGRKRRGRYSQMHLLQRGAGCLRWRADSLPRHREWACGLASAYGDSDVLADLRGLVNDIDGHVRERAAQAVRDLETRGVTEAP